MSIIKQIEIEIKNSIEKCGYKTDKIILTPTSRPEFGEYQINNAMMLGKENGKNPRLVAEEIVNELEKTNIFTNINIAGPGFINVTIDNSYLVNSINNIKTVNDCIDKKEKTKIIIDYGGANAGKALHVGHMRSANIGEALKRLARLLGKDIIGDVHLGDIGRQSGMIIYELKEERPDLPWFDEIFNGPYPPLEVTDEEIKTLYPKASIKAKENDEIMEEVRKYTLECENPNSKYFDLWKKYVDKTSTQIKKIYKQLNCEFDLWEGELDSLEYIDKVMEYFKGKLYESEGALVIDVKEETDKKEIPPCIIIKSNGATIYATRDLGTMYSRIKRFNPDEIWYVTDERQSLYFKQIFRAAYKTSLAKENTFLGHYGFGTMNGKDGKPFKTRDGGVMPLQDLIDLVKKEVIKKLRQDIIGEERDIIADKITISAIKFADLLPFRATDYAFDPEKFSDLEGKTGPYILYSTIRIKSLLNKAKEANIKFNTYKTITTKSEKDVLLNILNLPKSLNKSYEEKSLNEICEYLYKLTSSYNKFYSENKILIEENNDVRESWLTLSKLVLDINNTLLDTLAIEVPEKM